MRNYPSDTVRRVRKHLSLARNVVGPIVFLFAQSTLFCAMDAFAQEKEGSSIALQQESLQPDFIMGRVVDTEGKPIPSFGFLIRGGVVREDFPGPDGSILELTPNSNPQGEFRKKYHKAFGTKQTIVVEAPGYVRKYHVLDFGNGDQATDIRIVLDEAASVQGKVRWSIQTAMPCREPRYGSGRFHVPSIMAGQAHLRKRTRVAASFRTISLQAIRRSEFSMLTIPPPHLKWN